MRVRKSGNGHHNRVQVDQIETKLVTALKTAIVYRSDETGEG